MEPVLVHDRVPRVDVRVPVDLGRPDQRLFEMTAEVRSFDPRLRRIHVQRAVADALADAALRLPAASYAWTTYQ